MPLVSIIIPCYNEQDTIVLLLDAIDHQTFPRSEMEVVLADGMSSDRTREVIAAFQKKHPDLNITLVDNPKRIIPAALNCALNASHGEIIVRLDAHSMPAEDYIERSVADLRAGKGDNVGGVWQIRPQGTGWAARAIAAAAAHPFGVGDALYRYASQATEVDTVPFGAFYRSLFDRVGAFDETLLTNEDYEFNTRVRRQGGKIWLNPAIHSVYFARPDFSALSKQYWRYGFWKLRMLRRYPGTIRWRQALPPTFVLSLIGLALLSIFWMIPRVLLGLEVLLYLLVLSVGSIPVAIKQKDYSLLVGIPMAIMIMHVSWGSAFLWSLISLPFSQKRAI